MRTRVDISGQRFENLTAIAYSHTSKTHAYWSFKCECGEVVVRNGNDVRRGRIKSCGCRQRKSSIKSHGDAKTRLYQCWKGMKARCSTNMAYVSKGIEVCDEWAESYGSFKSWALSNGYTDSLTLDRIDGSGNYEPDNCRWATPKQQVNNINTNIILTYRDQTKTLAEWCDELGLKYATVWRRLKRTNMSVEDALKRKDVDMRCKDL